jgi:hypothetical protein
LKDKNAFEEWDFTKKFKIEFGDLSISTLTKKALAKRKFYKMTEI